eukprot:6173740-Pleurochrysis_carterae.AAC.1
MEVDGDDRRRKQAGKGDDNGDVAGGMEAMQYVFAYRLEQEEVSKATVRTGGARTTGKRTWKRIGLLKLSE